MRRLAEVGMTTREACGHTVRNVTADPLTGIADDCVFDVTPYAEAAMRYFLRNPVNQKLPRKFKITYSASPDDRGLIPMHDIGLMAVERDGKQGFRVSVGGGLGAAPRLADVLVEFIPVEEQLRTIEAAIRVWDRLGERRNKNKARIKFLVAKLGIDEFRRLYELELATLPPSFDERYREPDFTLLEEIPAGGSSRLAQWRRRASRARTSMCGGARTPSGRRRRRLEHGLRAAAYRRRDGRSDARARRDGAQVRERPHPHDGDAELRAALGARGRPAGCPRRRIRLLGCGSSLSGQGTTDTLTG